MTCPVNRIVGFHTSLTDEVKEIILSKVEAGLVIGQIARLSRIPKETLRRWLRRGEEEAHKEISSVFSQLWVSLEEKRGEQITLMLYDVRNRRTNWQASWELLKVVSREDFGVDALEFKELLEMFAKLREDYLRLKDNRPQGALINGNGLDSIGDQEAR